jgi:hypothetical protein
VPPRLWIVVAPAVAATVWSAYLDVAFFRSVLSRTRAAAAADAMLLRAIAWPLGTIYFFGYALWPLLVAWSRGV